MLVIKIATNSLPPSNWPSRKQERSKRFPYKFCVLSSRLQQKLIYGFMAVSNNKIIIILLLLDLVFGASFSSLFVCPNVLFTFLETFDESLRESLQQKSFTASGRMTVNLELNQGYKKLITPIAIERKWNQVGGDLRGCQIFRANFKEISLCLKSIRFMIPWTGRQVFP